MDSARQWWAGLKGLEKAVVVAGALIAALAVATVLGLTGASEPEDLSGQARTACLDQVKRALEEDGEDRIGQDAALSEGTLTGGRQGPWAMRGLAHEGGLSIGWSCEARLDGEDVIATATVSG